MVCMHAPECIDYLFCREQFYVLRKIRQELESSARVPPRCSLSLYYYPVITLVHLPLELRSRAGAYSSNHRFLTRTSAHTYYTAQERRRRARAASSEPGGRRLHQHWPAGHLCTLRLLQYVPTPASRWIVACQRSDNIVVCHAGDEAYN